MIASETTVALTGEAFAWRELDAIRVKGRTTPVEIYELVAEAGQETPQQQEAAVAYAQGSLARAGIRAGCEKPSARHRQALRAVLARARELAKKLSRRRMGAGQRAG